MKALKIVIIILVVLLAIILIPPLFMPSKLYVEQSMVMKAQPEVVYDQLNCLKNWEEWDVWHMDTTMEGYYEGPECGVGAKNIWKYKGKDDGGSQTIVESKENEYLKTMLDFQKMGTAESEIFLEKVDDGTKVTWNLKSESSYPIMRWINTVMVKPGVLASYEEGLINLNNLTANMKPKPKYSTSEVVITETEPMFALAIRSECKAEEISNVMGAAYGKIMEYAGKNGAQIAGAPMSIWYSWEGDKMVFDNVIPVDKKIKGSNDIKSITTYKGKVVKVTHTGDYESTQYSWGILENYIKENDLLEMNGDPWESYLTDPQSQPDPTKWVTELYWPIK
ncbi:MAG: GyrI-like domain-containing protein [Bacteroidales bacterium]|nr:GyrI-like domain-containing protein [Bacteroidales bacterium]